MTVMVMKENELLIIVAGKTSLSMYVKNKILKAFD